MISIHNVFDQGLLGEHSDRYRAQVMPELYRQPRQFQPVLANWSAEDKAAFCGGVWTTPKEAPRG